MAALSDIRLPEIDGYELIRRIRAREDSHARMPAVALTAFARSEDRTRAIRAGFQSHLPKPFERSELVFTVASFAKLNFAQRRS
jgi:CheY-like chemotaxis protein